MRCFTFLKGEEWYLDIAVSQQPFSSPESQDLNENSLVHQSWHKVLIAILNKSREVPMKEV